MAVCRPVSTEGKTSAIASAPDVHARDGGRRCLDENDLVAFLGGELTEADVAELDAHIDQCPDCLARTATFARTQTVDDARSVPNESTGSGDEMAAREPNTTLRRGTVVGRYAPSSSCSPACARNVVARERFIDERPSIPLWRARRHPEERREPERRPLSERLRAALENESRAGARPAPGGRRHCIGA
jgi:anti-sigma factor RsiW